MIAAARGAALAALALLLPVAMRAQSPFDAELRTAPQFLQYRLRSPADETISQLAVPLFVSVPVTAALTFDVGTSYARSRVTGADGTSEISGLTDTQIRGNYTLGADFVVLTAGVSLPTGRSSVTLDEFAAAARIGNDFLSFPISNMGTGLAATLGVAVARPVGEWNLGAGGAVRRSRGYEPFDIPGQSLHFQPGNEYRARVGADRTVGGGRVALGLSYSAFGHDDAGGSVYNTGDRLIAQAAYSTLVGGHEASVAAYNVFRAPGSYASGEPSGRENLANLLATVGVETLGRVWEPSVELRHWLQHVPAGATTGESTRTSYLATAGLRMRMDLGGVRLTPSAGYTVGTIAASDAAGAPAQAGLTGFRLQLAGRFAPFADR